MLGEMNRIIILGNGFDLAHGMKTSYKDFIDRFWECREQQIRYGNSVDDDFVEIKVPKVKDVRDNEPMNLTGYDWLQHVSEVPFFGNDGAFEVKNKFLEHLSKNYKSERWSGIEAEYYKQLLKTMQSQEDTVEHLNADFESVRRCLESYLKIQNNKSVSAISSISSDIFGDEDSINATLVLNFNYTNTERLYVSGAEDKIQVIHIHGQLGSEKNPIIFGYGDDTDENYRTVSNQGDNKYLDNIKTFQYNKVDNRKKLSKFIDSGDYEVFVVGHSCEVSDKTILRQILSNENCRSIRLFYHQLSEHENNFQELNQNLSRILGDNDRLSEILVPESESSRIG